MTVNYQSDKQFFVLWSLVQVRPNSAAMMLEVETKTKFHASHLKTPLTSPATNPAMHISSSQIPNHSKTS
jgi:hypothetical protein